MNKIETFFIENEKFEIDLSLIDKDNFIIKSIPKPYNVSWIEEKNPIIKINTLLNENPNNILLIDENVYNIHKNNLQNNPDKTYIANATEKFKTITGVLDVISYLQNRSFSKAENLIVVGGGIIEDVGAFVGACYKRGIRWTYFPTTLLSMCDSCIGGKTGINHNNAKNQLALFSAPEQVFINPNFIKTLAPKDIQSGMGEVYKLLITGGKSLIKIYQENIIQGKIINFNSYKPLIKLSLSTKKAIIEKDEFELNLRKSLNYGHTLGHAIEIISNYQIPHGLGVVIGCILANEISYRKDLLQAQENENLKKLGFELLDHKTLEIMKNINTDQIIELLLKDKKTLKDSATFILLKSIGDMIFTPIKLDNKFLIEINQIIKELFQ